MHGLVGCEREAGFVPLREALITHFAQARAKKEVRWLRTAADCRASQEQAESEEEECDEWGVLSEDTE